MTASSTAQAKSDAPHRGTDGGSNPIVSALYQMAVSVLGEQLREMFEKADDILFDSAEKARGGDEQRLYLDTMRIVRVQRAKIIEAFQESLTHALSKIETSTETADGVADLNDVSQWSLQDGDALEERIAVTNMETKASSLHAHELVELQRRLSRLAQLSGGGLSPDAMSPARIIRAFQSSVRDLHVDFPIKLVIYKLFDRVVVGRLSEVFVGANQLLAVHGIEPSLDPPKTRKPTVAAGRPVNDPAAARTSWAEALDPTTLGAFGAPSMSSVPGAAMYPGGSGGMAWPEGMAMTAGMAAAAQAGGYPQWQQAWSQGAAAMQSGAAAGTYSDALLSNDIAHILGAYAHGERPQAPAWLPPENVALVARMFDGYYRDPRLSDNLKQLLSRLQLPVLKTALADQRFFSDPEHPARRASNDLFDMLLQFGGSDAAASPQMVSEVQGLVEALVRAFNLDPNRLRQAPSESVDEQTAEGFLRDQEAQQQQQKNRGKVERIRRIVAHELRRRIGERELPSGVMRLMLSGFGPLLCLDYIRNGVEGSSWNRTMQLVDRVIESLEPSRDNSSVSARAEVTAAVSRRLADIGFSEQKLEEVISGLLSAYEIATVAAPADGSTAPSRRPAALAPEKELQGLLSILLVQGGWFTLWDPKTQTKHWLRVKSYYPQQNTVVFSHYMEERFLRMHATAFATDLVEGRAAAIDPAAELQTAIARISDLPFERVSDPIQWTQGDGKPVAATLH
ncbi:DUF1631 domain-containing protein [Sinimarinibacterium sp. CAU 1509]|uniref:DUF1631 family protein n=1 Tax=Sinimarinibacterium sp. CAU 1509 TaxID=2562283 RepID=UPI0010AD2A37|nr:DUF1631 family protein [Sinimarinibacterium sp. CAU 1509]TJY63045.1 DUF1631 domain-containing protein [Sinimarinibacterium sp. CAU 1509]